MKNSQNGIDQKPTTKKATMEIKKESKTNFLPSLANLKSI